MRRATLLATIASFAFAPSTFAQQQRGALAEKQGLAAVLADDQKLLSELSRRQMKTLLDHAFSINKIPPEQQRIYLTLSSLKQLTDPNVKLSRKQQQELVSAVAAGIDQVLAQTGEPELLLNYNNLLIRGGTMRHLNTLEYWGENTKTQSQLRPIAEAVDKVYERAIELAVKRADEAANKISGTNDPNVKVWERMTNLAGLAKLNSAFNKYTLALSIDKADARRAHIAEEAIKIFTEFEDPQYEIVPMARLALGKLQLAIGTPERIKEAREKFQQVLADSKAEWGLRFQAVYFNATADLVAKDPAAAQKNAEQVRQWVAENPLPAETPARDEEVKKIDAALAMLNYRILSTQAEIASGDAAAKANAAAIALLQDLLKKRPDLASVINEQLIARLPESPDVQSLSPLLLRALVARGDEESRKPENEPADKKTLTQAIAAAKELISRAGRDGVTAEDADLCTLLLGFMHSRMNQDVEASRYFLDHVEKYRNDAQRMQLALDAAERSVARLQRTAPELAATQTSYLRFLRIATAPPFSRGEYNYPYARQLLEQNISEMQASYSDAQRQQLLENARKAAELFAKVPEKERQLYARYFELQAYNQMILLSPPGSVEIANQVRKCQELASLVNKMIDAELASAADDESKRRLRSLRVQTTILAADLAKHDKGSTRDASLETALSLLNGIEARIQGLPNASALLGDVFFIRVNALMSLGRAEQALDDLGRFLDTKSGDDGIRIVYDMLTTLDKEFKQAQQDRNQDRSRELAGHLARVSGYLVDRVEKSTRPETKKLLWQYKFFEARNLQVAASLESDPAKKRKYLEDALAIFETAAKNSPEDQGLPLAIAHVQFDLGNHAAAQPVFLDYLTQGLVGRPKMVVQTPGGGSRYEDNHQYWETMYKLLRSNVELTRLNAANFGPTVLEETRQKLKQLYIQWGEPGGPRWSDRFAALRQEILPDWTPPALTTPDASTRPTEAASAR